MGENSNDPNSPYYLHPNEDPSAKITPTILKTKQQFWLWSRSFRLALIAKNKIGFIDGTITKPSINNNNDEDPKLLSQWNRCNAMVQSWILNTIDPKLHEIIPNCNTAKELYDHVRKNLSIPRNLRVYQLMEAMRDAKKRENVSAVVFVRKFMALYYELESLYEDKKPECYGNGCKCEKVKKYKDERWDEEMRFWFLLGLDGKRFGDVRLEILLMEELPSFDRIVEVLLVEEDRQNFVKSRDSRAN